MREIKMGMAKEQFIENMELLGGAFPRNGFMEENVINVWWRFFGKYDPDVFGQIIYDWIIHKPNAPTIADLKTDLNKAQVDKYRALEQEDDVPRDTYINSRDWFGK